jgi:hypothetical protein
MLRTSILAALCLSLASASCNNCGVVDRPKINWDNPINGNEESLAVARQKGPPGVFQPGLGEPAHVFLARGSSPSTVVFVYDLTRDGRVLVYETKSDVSAAQYHESLRSVANQTAGGCHTGSFEIRTIRGGTEAMLTISDDGSSSTVDWLQRGLQIRIHGRTLSAERALVLAERI